MKHQLKSCNSITGDNRPTISSDGPSCGGGGWTGDVRMYIVRVCECVFVSRGYYISGWRMCGAGIEHLLDYSDLYIIRVPEPEPKLPH